MATLTPSGLETIATGSSGWAIINAVFTSNMQRINTYLGTMFDGDHATGTTTIADAAAATAEALTDSSGGSASQTIAAVSGSGADTTINNNFASLTDEIEKLRADNAELRTQLNALLAELRGTTGVGVLDS